MNRINASLLSLIVLLFASCASVKDSATKVAYVNYTSSTLVADEADGFATLPGVELGLTYGGSGESDRAVGLLGDIALRASDGGDNWDGIDVDVRSLGIRTGLRYYFDTGTRLIQPFLGGSLVAQHYWFEDETSKADKSAIGFMGMAGIESQLTDHLRFNVGYSLTGGLEPKVDGEKIDMDAGAFILGLGWSF